MPKSQKNPLHKCTCGCNRLVTRWTIRRHTKTNSTAIVQLESPPPLKRRRIAHSRADASSSSSGHPQLDAHSFEFTPPLSLSDPAAASPGDAHTNASSHFIDDFLLNLHARTRRTTNESDSEDSEDALGEDAVETADYIDPETDDSWDGEDVDIEGDVDPRDGIVSDSDVLAEEFIAEAEGLGKFEHSLLQTP